jgi:hypothetical protein
MPFQLGAVIVVAMMAAATAGCGTVEDTIDGTVSGMRGDPAPSGEPVAEADSGARAILVTVMIESDGATASDVTVDVDARRNSQSVKEENVELPYTAEFSVPTDTMFPLKGTTVRAKASADASEISCSILYDGEVVATDLSRGDRAAVECDKEFELGPG